MPFFLPPSVILCGLGYGGGAETYQNDLGFLKLLKSLLQSLTPMIPKCHFPTTSWEICHVL